MTAWYYSDAQRNRHGPVAASDLAALHAGGGLAPDVLVWREGLAEWRPWRELMGEVLQTGPAAAPARFAVAGADAPAHVTGNPCELAERGSPYAAPRAVLAQASDWQAGGAVVYAGFWKRAAASVIDSFIVGTVGVAMQMLIMVVAFGGIAAMGADDPSALFGSGAGMAGLAALYLVPLAMQAVYFAGFHSSGWQATPGKRAVGIKVTAEDGRPIGFWRGIGRYAATILSALILMIGYFMAAFTDRKRALHDMVANTLVVDRWAFTAHPERQRPELGTVTTVILVVGALLVLGYLALVVALVVFAGMSGLGG